MDLINNSLTNPLIPPNPSLGIQFFTVFAIIWQRQLIHNYYANRTPLPPNDSYDFIVVGAGSAGSIVACRLSQWGKNVLLLEAGGAQDALLTDHPGMNIRQLVDGQGDKLWHYYNEPQVYTGRAYANSSMTEVKGKILGGSSAVNFMAYVRGSRRDFDNLVEKYGAYGWSYDELLPLFKRSENNTNFNNQYHGVSGPMPVRYNPHIELSQILLDKAYNEQGYPSLDVNAATQIGNAINQFNNNGIRQGPANAFLESGICPKLTIVTRALVTKVVMNYGSDGVPFASGVEFLKEGNTYCVKANKEVIVSTGPIASPQLLMLSGIGHRDHLKQKDISPVFADLPVGDNLCNHIGILNNALHRNYSFLTPPPNLEVQQLYQANVLGIGPLSQVSASVFMKVSSVVPSDQKDWSDILIFGMNSYHDVPGFAGIYQFGENVEEWEEYVKDLNKYDLMTFMPVLSRARSRGTIRLRSSDPTDLPVINPNFLVEPSDREAFMEIVAYSFYITEATSFSKYAYVNPNPIPGCRYCPDKPVYQCKSYLKCFILKYSASLVHPVGTVRMGDPSRPDVVVDPRLRVKGVRRLRVIDSSIYAECINGNTNAASMLVGEKGADLVQQDHP